VTITVNTNKGVPYNTGTNKDRAITVLHELGHAFNIVAGAGHSYIKDDQDDPAASASNTDLIKQQCF